MAASVCHLCGKRNRDMFLSYSGRKNNSDSLKLITVTVNFRLNQAYANVAEVVGVVLLVNEHHLKNPGNFVFVYLRSTCDASNFQSKREEQMFYD
jgi:hypothetical protein